MSEPTDTPIPQAPPESADAAPPTSGDAAATDPLDAARADAAKLKDQLLRTAAELDNTRKRARKEVEDARKAGREELLKELLPVFDNVDRAMTSARSATEVKPVAEGLAMIGKQFESTLARLGLAKVESVGTAFDPQIHEAIQQIETDDHPAGTVVAEVQSGWKNGDRLVRAAMVVVAKPRAAAPAGDVS